MSVTIKRSLRRWFLAIGGLCLLLICAGVYEETVGFPRYVRGRWVHKRIEWYGLGTGLPVLYPGVVDYVYRDAAGNLVKHGPYHRYVFQSGWIRLNAEGFFRDGLPDGTFTEWNTYDGTKQSETFYADGQPIGDAWYQKGRLFQYRRNLYDGKKRIATKTFSNGRWFLDKVSACLNFTVDPQTGDVLYLNKVVCQ